MSKWIVIQWATFLVASAGLLWISRRPLASRGSHGFYRFFAWEAIVGLTVLNLPVWFRSPFSPAQLASWLLLTGSALLVLHALRLFHTVGHAGGRSARAARDEPEGANYAFENTSQLVRVGAYRFIRHPMYASLLYGAWGVYLKRPGSPVCFALVVAASVLLWLTALADEAECVRAFGADYERYMSGTKRFVPFLL